MDLLAHTSAVLALRAGMDFRRRRYVLAVSGGLDSMLLLEIFAQLVPREQLTIAHFNHGVRATATRDEQLVARRARELTIAVSCGQHMAGATDEASLREARRRFLLEVRQTVEADFIVTAHHADDQLETLLMRLLRGTGLDGLAGIRACAPPWLRPFLSLSRAALEKEARSRGLLFHDDETNATDVYLRNRVRHRLVPAFHQLSGEFGGPDLVLRRLVASLEEVGSVADECDRQAETLFVAMATRTEFFLRLEARAFTALGREWQGRLLRRIFRELHAEVPSRAVTDSLREAIAENARGLALPGVLMTLSCGQLYFQNEAQRTKSAEPLVFVEQGERWECRALGLSISRVGEAFPGASVRFFEPGDRFRHAKLKAHFLQCRIPRLERRFIALIAMPRSREVLWHYPQPHPPLRLVGPAFPLATPTFPPAK